MTTSNVNFLASTFSYATTSQTVEGMKDILVKFMVTGFDPLPIDSITVTSKVARVVTTEKDFHTVAGVKFTMAGTNNVAIDTRQEVQEVFSDGFSFNVDTPNATFTNGLTYSVSPLGWSLLERDANRLLLKTGTGAVNEVCLLIEKTMTDGGFNIQRARSVYGATNFKTVKNIVNARDANSQLPFTDYAGYGVFDTIYWMYGDDSFIYIGAYRYSSSGVGRNATFYYCSTFAFGELVSISNRIPFHYIVGGEGRGVAYSTGEYGNAVFNNTDLGTASFKISKDISVGLPASMKTLGYNPAFTSGQERSYLNYLLPAKQKLLPFDIQTSDFIHMGSLPGSYFVQEAIPGFAGLPYANQQFTFSNKIRNCLFMGMGAAYNNGVRGGFLLDLTGPIR